MPHSIPCDVGFAADVVEARWEFHLNRAIGDEAWCTQVNPFDSQLLFGRTRPGSTLESICRNDAERRRERIARCSTGCFIPPHELLLEWIQ